jgi:hypothetical protein
MASKKSQSSWGGAIIVIVGLPDAAAKESRDRVTTALTNKLKGCPAPIHAAYEVVVMQPMKPLQGLRFLCLGALGSSCLATQGWQIQSLWDWGKHTTPPRTMPGIPPKTAKNIADSDGLPPFRPVPEAAGSFPVGGTGCASG